MSNNLKNESSEIKKENTFKNILLWIAKNLKFLFIPG